MTMQAVTQRVPPTHQNFTQHRVEVSVKIPADIRRIFNALTIAEYLEAWLCFPDCDPFSSVVVSQTQRGFDINLTLAYRRTPSLKIHAVYLTREPHEVAFTWVKQPASLKSETTVIIDLNGTHSSTSLHLSHAGFINISDRRWHEDTWRASLEKLCLVVC
jgi:uncharacterized protein YndB with AHSA1/START domain